MVGTNRPVAWRVIDRQSNKIVATYESMDSAHDDADRREPYPEVTGYRFVVDPVRASALTS